MGTRHGLADPGRKSVHGYPAFFLRLRALGLGHDPRRGVATTATRLGGRSLGQGNPPEAVRYFREALAADPTAAGDSAMAGLARALAGLHDTTTTAPKDSAGTGKMENTQ